MKKYLLLISMVSLSACVGGNNDGYVQKDVWLDNGVIHARADATEKTESLCFNKAKMSARDKISHYVVEAYKGTDNVKILDDKEQFSSDRTSLTESLFKSANYLIKPYDKKTKTCGVEMQVSVDEAEGLLEK